MTGLDSESGAEVRLFHPRQDRWSAHFSIDSDAVIIGATPIGRATVTCLAFNSDNQLWARKRWMRLGLFP